VWSDRGNGHLPDQPLLNFLPDPPHPDAVLLFDRRMDRRVERFRERFVGLDGSSWVGE
jgi:hypothetical protein